MTAWQLRESAERARESARERGPQLHPRDGARARCLAARAHTHRTARVWVGGDGDDACVCVAAAVVVAACCCCAMAVGLWTAATMGREEDDDPPEQVREIQLHGLRPWKAPDGDNVVVGG